MTNTQTQKQFDFAVVHDIVVVVHGPQSPPDPSWDRLLDTVLAFHHAKKVARVLVWSVGGAPTTAQRHRMDQRIRTSITPTTSAPSARIAILAQSTFVRAVVNASVTLESGWFRAVEGALRGSQEPSRVYRAFTLNEIRPAIGWLNVPAADSAAVEKTLQKLRSEVAGA